MRANDLRRKYIEFFKERGHAEIGSASLIPENDPTVLFTTAGMHPLVPFLLGEKHPAGNRLVSCQKCIRTGDIDEVGDASHLTFFEMLGNWSLGDYFKEDAIKWSWDFLTDPKWLGLDKDRISVTCFEGDADAPKDTEAAEFWEKCGVPKERIFFLGKKHNWWGPAGQTGPCGPDTEMFWHTDTPACGPDCSPACSCGHYVEIWNDVFMQFEKTADGKFIELKQKNVDTGMGLVRTAAALQGAKSAYETELYAPLMEKVASMVPAGNPIDVVPQRVICDHMTAAVMIISDGVEPGNKGAGYVLRRLIRRAVRMGRKLGIEGPVCADVASGVIDIYADAYPVVAKKRDHILGSLRDEEAAFTEAFARGMKEFERIASGIEKGKAHGGSNNFPMKKAFELTATYGFPPEVTHDLCRERGYAWDQTKFDEAEEAHKKISHGDGGTFKGGLADNSVATTRLHTATHLLHAALRQVLGSHVEQRGSNITAERLRFDFSHPAKMTDDEKKRVQELVQQAIDADAPIGFEEMTVEQAKTAGAIGLFGDKYGEKVKVYTMGTFSKEICGGPHAERTGALGKFTLDKEEASSTGVRRIRASLKSPA